mmetsp:Transcript_32845/g.77524  ORF Transcript_32845/g.77524 Transcript_32845/m.77524 type:complete len:225 (-) Transcript_32845:453-1127(-)
MTMTMTTTLGMIMIMMMMMMMIMAMAMAMLAGSITSGTTIFVAAATKEGSTKLSFAPELELEREPEREPERERTPVAPHGPQPELQLHTPRRSRRTTPDPGHDPHEPRPELQLVRGRGRRRPVQGPPDQHHAPQARPLRVQPDLVVGNGDPPALSGRAQHVPARDPTAGHGRGGRLDSRTDRLLAGTQPGRAVSGEGIAAGARAGAGAAACRGRPPPRGQWQWH